MVFLQCRLAGEQSQRRAIIDARSIACRYRSVFAEGGLERAELFHRRVCARVFVMLQLSFGGGDAYDLALEGLRTGRGALLALEGKGILIGTVDLELVRDALRCLAHAQLYYGITETIGKHG